MSLGTVQLGMAYSLNETIGKPTDDEAFAMLDRAMELGVNNLDTSNDYGDSQRIIGRWLKKRIADGAPTPIIVTKIGKLDHSSYDALRDDIRRKADGCRKELGVETLDFLALHNFEDYADDPDATRKIFAELKRDGYCRYSEISAYSHHDYGAIAASGFDAVQIPQNVFDWTKIEDGGIDKLAASGMMVFVRSVFLQGLVFFRPETLDPRMDFCKPYLKRYLELCSEFSLSPAVLALSFVLSLPGITTVVLGCQNKAQIESNCALIDQTVSLTSEQMDKLHQAFHGIDPRVINPHTWYNA